MNSDNKVLERVSKWLRGEPRGPFMLELRPTNKCNLRCPSCLARGYPPYEKERELSLQEYLRIIDDAAELGVQHLQIVGGGEPMARAEVTIGIMKRAKEHRMSGFLLTNGTLFSDKAVREIVEMEWDTILFSIDGPDARTNDYLRGREGAFEQSTGTIRVFNSWKKRLGAENISLILAPVLSNRNCDRLADIVRLAAELGVREVLFQPLQVPDSALGRPLSLTDQQKREMPWHMREAKAAADALDVRTNLDQIDQTMVEHSSSLPVAISFYADGFKDNPLLSIRCFSPWFYLGIDANGRMGPCSNEAPETYVADVREHGLSEVWYGRRFTAFREGLHSGKLPEICRNCCGTVVLEMKKLREKLGGGVST